MKHSFLSLYYHSIADYPLSVPVDTFRKQLYFFRKKGYDSKCIKDIDTDSPQTKHVFITFDDCFASVSENAITILNEYYFKATFFATINYIGIRRWGSTKYQQWSDEKTEDFNIPFDYMDWEQLKELVDLGMEIGAHTITHRNLTELSQAEQEEEIIGSKEILENKLGIEVSSFCYPRGKFDNHIINIVKKAGYKYACTTIPGYISQNDNPFAINRFACGSFDIHFKSLFDSNYNTLFRFKTSLKTALTR
jgi:peptidoglycan/xylan/chitin deacetylase (PgdA/CDA1 family)